jgi:hypothetical protein
VSGADKRLEKQAAGGAKYTMPNFQNKSVFMGTLDLA